MIEVSENLCNLVRFNFDSGCWQQILSCEFVLFSMYSYLQHSVLKKAVYLLLNFTKTKENYFLGYTLRFGFFPKNTSVSLSTYKIFQHIRFFSISPISYWCLISFHDIDYVNVLWPCLNASPGTADSWCSFAIRSVGLAESYLADCPAMLTNANKSGWPQIHFEEIYRTIQYWR